MSHVMQLLRKQVTSNIGTLSYTGYNVVELQLHYHIKHIYVIKNTLLKMVFTIKDSMTLLITPIIVKFCIKIGKTIQTFFVLI